MKRRWIILIVLLLISAGLAVVTWRYLLPWYSNTLSGSNEVIGRWFESRANRPALTNLRTQCPGAPFLLPSEGLIGLLWNDPAAPYSIRATHTGLDIFGDGQPGTAPVYAVADGLLSRSGDWLSSVIIRHDDPLVPGRVIWSYYTHMASRDGSTSYIAPRFPADTFGVPVEQGDLLGYQGEYAGVGRPPIGLHLHFSLVLSAEDGSYLNEAVLANTIDPSPYFGMPLTILDEPPRPIPCRAS
jgi:peptidoglycan LD-endopeptidase LytH